MAILIIKRNGSEEPYEQEKITKVVQAAGLRPIDAEELAQKVTDWLEKRNKGKVTSIEVRDKVFKELEKVDKYASGLYAWYQNLKDKKYSQSSTTQ